MAGGAEGTLDVRLGGRMSSTGVVGLEPVVAGALRPERLATAQAAFDTSHSKLGIAASPHAQDDRSASRHHHAVVTVNRTVQPGSAVPHRNSVRTSSAAT
jgi:hypothetical protein